MRPDLISFTAALGLSLGGGFLLGTEYVIAGVICLLVMCAFVWDLVAQWNHNEQRAAEDAHMGKTRQS